MKALHRETPIWESLPLSRALGATVLLKMEALQPVGITATRFFTEVITQIESLDNNLMAYYANDFANKQDYVGSTIIELNYKFVTVSELLEFNKHI